MSPASFTPVDAFVQIALVLASLLVAGLAADAGEGGQGIARQGADRIAWTLPSHSLHMSTNDGTGVSQRRLVVRSRSWVALSI